VFRNFLQKESCRLWDNVENIVKLDMPEVTIRVHCVLIALWIPKATKTLSV
jgi:hypothetical protein